MTLKKFYSLLIVCALFSIIASLLWPQKLDTPAQNTVYPVENIDGEDIPPRTKEISFWRDTPLRMEDIKKFGCVSDGLLSGYGDTSTNTSIAHESSCRYFHRALETWLAPPDFPRAREILTEIDRPDAVFSMFIAEAIDRKSDYFYRAEDRYFDFSEMCRSGSKNFWGEHTCKPSLKKEEYRAYLKQITEDAMDLGIRVFIFGQIKYQEESYTFPKVDNVIRDMRIYADTHNIDILIGAQTGEIRRKSYLKHFDFIEGGVGISLQGTTENGPCFSRYWKKSGDWCWPLMWHNEYTDLSDNVFIYLDWNGQQGDDMHTLASMPSQLRHATLARLHKKFTDDDIGFFLPLLTPLPRDENACHGLDRDFYSASMGHGCPDLDAINDILQ